MSKPSPSKRSEQAVPLPTEYWMIVAEIDATIFCIEDAAQRMVKRLPIERMIDQVTGYDKEQTELLQYWSDRLKQLTALLPPEDPHFRSAQQDTHETVGQDKSSKIANNNTPPQG